MNQTNTNAIILDVFDFKENNKIIRVFSKEYGKLDLIYKKNNNIKYCNLDIFNEIYCKITFHNDYMFLNEMDLISSNYKIRDEYKKIVYGNIVSEILNNAFPTDYSDYKIYDLTSKFYKLLAISNENSYLLLLAYILKLLAYSGFKIDFNSCNLCNICSDKYYYSIKDSLLLCKDCNNKYNNIIISNKQIRLLNKLLYSKLDLSLSIIYEDKNYLLIFLTKIVINSFEITELDSAKFLYFD